MKISETPLQDAYLIQLFRAEDERGVFFKPFHFSGLLSQGIRFEPLESICSSSKINVLRGMHFQEGEFAQAKLVYCPHGSILDVILDMRPGSRTFGKHLAVELSAENGMALYIPEGFAHGFLALTDVALTSYLMTKEYEPKADKGILWNSFGFNWPVDNPFVSERDRGFGEFVRLEK